MESKESNQTKKTHIGSYEESQCLQILDHTGSSGG